MDLIDTDVTIYCNDGTVAAHKLVLGSISQMLFVEFSINFQDEAISIILPDVSSDHVSKYLDAIYNCQNVSNFYGLNEMFGYEMAVSFLPNLLNYNEEEDKVEEDDSVELVDGDDPQIDEIENNTEIEYKKPVIIPFYKKPTTPVTEGPNKIISFMKKNHIKVGSTVRKSSKVWLHFREDPMDPIKRICRHCGLEVICPDKSTTPMHSHITSKHKDKVFSVDDRVILQNFQDDDINNPIQSFGEKKTKRVRTDEDRDESHIDPETGEMSSPRKKARSRSKTSQVWQYFTEDPTENAREDDITRSICKICSAVVCRSSSSTARLISHLSSMHGVTIKSSRDKDESGESLMCSICGQIFSNKAKRDRHEKVHLEQYKVYCTFCGKGFMEESRRMKHERTHTGEKPHEVRSDDPLHDIDNDICSALSAGRGSPRSVS